ncbi:exosporium protein D [Lysinibacillus agricola]|uniref:exosporium protein D n=1 Tax=Lysinibacillus agricola TaxID=2590012 RepID=UPI003C179F42
MNSNFNCGCKESCSCNCCTPLKFKARDVCQIPQGNPCIPGPPAPQEIKCFVDTHELSNKRMILSPSATEPIFEDTTCNHNKTLLVLSSIQANIAESQPISFTIRLRGSEIPLIVVVSADNTRLVQVEDFKSLVASNLSEDNNAELEITIQKTFCICCDTDCADAEKYSSFSRLQQKGESFIATHTFDEIVRVPPIDAGGATEIVFEDFTKNHNKTLLVLKNSDFRGVSITIQTSTCNTPITADIPRGGLRIFQVENFKSLSLTNPINFASAVLTITGEKTFCINCNSEDNIQKCESCCKE